MTLSWIAFDKIFLTWSHSLYNRRNAKGICVLPWKTSFNDLLSCLYNLYSVFSTASSRSALCFHPNFGWLVLVVGGWWLNNARKTLKNRNCDHCDHCVNHSPFDVCSGTRIIIFDYQDQCLPQACLYKVWRKWCEKLPEDCSKWTFESFLSPGEGNVHLESTSQEGTSTLHVLTMFNLWQPSFAFLCRSMPEGNNVATCAKAKTQETFANCKFGCKAWINVLKTQRN